MGTSAWSISDSPTLPADNGGWTISNSPKPSKSKFSQTAQINYSHPAGLERDSLPAVPSVPKQLPKGPSLFKQLETPPDNVFTRLAEGKSDLTKTDTNPNENPVVRGLSNFGAGAIQAAAAIPAAITDVPGTIIRGAEGAGKVVNDLENPYQAVPAAVDAAHEFAQHPVENLEKGAGQAAGTFIAGELPGSIAEAAPQAAETSATGMINRTVGATSKDFERGANPGRGYLRAKIGPSASMQSMADKATIARNGVGQQLGNTYRVASTIGVKIPAQEVEDAIDSVIENARNSAAGPGVMADPKAYDDLRRTFDFDIARAKAKGGFTPSEIWEIRKNIDRNLNWGDQSKLNMTKVQQQVSGALGGVLEDALPQTKALNQTYQDLTKFRRRAQLRADTGSSPLTSLARKATRAGAGALVGGALHSAPAEIGLGLAGAAADSIPVRTAVASGINAAGKAAEAAAPVLRKAALPAVASAEAGNLAAAPESSIPEPLAAVATNQVKGNPEKNTDNEKQNPGNNAQTPPPPTVPSSIAQTPNATPETHVFSITDWQDANPYGDLSEAIREAKRQGYDIEE